MDTNTIDSTDFIFGEVRFLFYTVAIDLQFLHGRYHSIRFKFENIGNQNEKVSGNIDDGFG